ncbi:CrcB protein [Halorubrum aquaticum]|uniref:Fluoride-specific ion channel FluC n=1 Tax=Halorubrum aquaticum TaxID=387340 RepID=A0A1I3CDM6_9EURY|nr:CrcB family protein [Halorubrum aquaticum]SFH72406.1 CrcB protein [Halorubrum aquaticum]
MERTVAGVGFVALGGFVGALARYGVDVAAGDVTGLGTLVVNVVGSFALGFLVTRAVGPRTRLLVGTGMISSFTTYSTFATDAVALGTVGGTAYVAASYGLGFAAALSGLAAGRRL